MYSNASQTTLSSNNTPLTFDIQGERARIDDSGRLLVGTTDGSGGVSKLVVQGASNGSAVGVAQISYNGLASAGLAAGTDIGYLRFTDQGSNSGVFAQITATADATTGANDYPGRLVFSTTADGAGSPTERMRITSGGDTTVSNCEYLYPTSDNVVELGGATNRWQAVWAANGTIQTSDQRAKTEIADTQLGSEFIKSLRPVSYKWIDGGKRDTGERDGDGNYIYESVPGTRTHWGFIAQEVKQAVDAAGVDFGGWVLTDKDDPDSQQALRYDQFIAPLTKALQEALAKIETLKQRLNDAGIA